ncbi:MAG: hypothetical protein Q4G03_04675 [Planctomycetia bacterium]|nr:hypothetical protein [Planctomycetia bacterium]
MLKNVEIICFQACYLLVFVLECVRLAFARKNKWLAVAANVMAIAGCVAHGAFLYYNDLLQNDHFFAKVSSWFILFAFVLTLISLYLSAVYRRTRFHLFFMPAAIVLIVVALKAGNATFAREGTANCIQATHGAALAIAASLYFFGALNGALFRLQRKRLKNPTSNASLPLPTIEWLNKSTRLAVNSATLALGVGVLSGYYLRSFTASQNEAQLDPVAIGATVLFILALVERFTGEFLSKRRLDACVRDSRLALIVFIILCVLLYLAAFTRNGHFRKLTIDANSAYNAQSEFITALCAESPPPWRDKSCF